MKNKKLSSCFSIFIKGSLTVLFSVLVVYGVVQAGATITPPSGAPSASLYTLSDIWTRLTTNATATESGHLFTFADSLASTHVTLTQIYNAIPTINASKLLDDTTYLGITGNIATQTLSSASKDVNLGYYTATTLDAVDTDLASGNIKSGINIFGIDGDSNVVDTSTGDAVVGDILLNKIAFVDGSSLTGTMPNNGAFSLTAGVGDQAVTAGYYSGGTLAGDPDLIATSIGADINIFGVTGTLLKNLYNGSASSGDYPGAGVVGDVGGVDDYNAGGARPATSYAKTWTTCDDTSSCGTPIDTTNADKKDNSTGLVWSKWLYGGAAKTWFYANNCLYPNGLGDGVCDTHNEAACKCVKLTGTGEGGNGEKTGCDALGNGWRLPYQKELMQAYIDGSWNSPANLSSAGYLYWSATTTSNATQTAWTTYLYNGLTLNGNKTNGGSYRVRCVR